MPRTSYQYETSPRKYEPEYTRISSTKEKKVQKKKVAKKNTAKVLAERQKAKKAQEKKNKFIQVVLVIAVFGMLLAISYREISIMEMFNQKKDMESQLAVIEKENGQVQKNIKEEESKLDWNEIKKRETEDQEKEIAIQVNGKVRATITVDTNDTEDDIKKKATEELGMQTKIGTPVNLEKTDNVETKTKLIKEEKTSILEKIVEYFVIK